MTLIFKNDESASSHERKQVFNSDTIYQKGRASLRSRNPIYIAMPKKSARKKKEKNEDFKKTKLKVGKKKALPDSHTDTSFKARAVVLPGQSITQDKSHELVNVRNLTLNELLIQLKHHNANTRKDAVQGLRDLFNRHPGLLAHSMSTLSNSIVRLFVDDDEAVRKATHAFLSEFFVEMEMDHLKPFLSLFIIYTCSAMTHIHEDIRLDAVKCMDIWIRIAPDTVASPAFWDKITGNYVSLLTIDSNAANMSKRTTGAFTASRSGMASPRARARVLASLARFLEVGLGRNQQNTYWFFSNFLMKENARRDFARMWDGDSSNNVVTWSSNEPNQTLPVHPCVSSFLPDLKPSPALGLYLIEQGANDTKQPGAKLASQAADNKTYFLSAKNLIEILQPIFVSIWLDHAPSVFTAATGVNPGPSLEAIQLVLKVMGILWRAVLSDFEGTKTEITEEWLDRHLNQFLKHFLAYFPFGSDTYHARDTRTDSDLLDMNTIICEIVALFLLARSSLSSRESTERESTVQPPRKGKRRREEKEEGWVERVVEYIVSLFGCESNSRKRIKLSQATSGGGMTTATTGFGHEHLVALLPAVWVLLNSLEEVNVEWLFEAFLEYYKRTHSYSNTKRTCIEFLARAFTIQTNPSYTGKFRVDHGLLLSGMEEVLAGLPKVLGEMGSKGEETKRVILKLLCEVAKKGKTSSISQKVQKRIGEDILTLFSQSQHRPALLASFSSPIQRLLIEYLFYAGPSIKERIMAYFEEDHVPVEIRQYARQVLAW
ncbi:uncharacterized protein VTP21DRAFT_5243 [Calcarisporiella thermophila]|uniref:uncharacterized protein n=1 Tax=Calcarisporiella thermophila TaxID=911321 RepID=UPI0037427AF2